jgi:tetrapyrrole methylase family protein/MazG family protein
MSGTITIVGLGSGNENQLTLGVWKTLKAAKKIYVRTEQHPVAAYMRAEGIQFESFDSLYEANESFSSTYEAIVAALFTEASESLYPIVYGVPGHPMVAEATVLQLIAGGQDKGITIHVIGGESFMDQAFIRLGFDPIEGFQLLNASELKAEYIRTQIHTVIAQVFDSFTASDVKLALMEVYPDDYPIVVAHALGVVGEEQIATLPLYEIDRIESYGNLSIIYVPPTEEQSLRNRTFERLHEIVQILRSPEGCPWDREQTHSSLRKNLIEETYEVLETIDDNNPVTMCEELGDLLLQVLLHAQMEEEEGTFTVWDVIKGLNEKLIRRHPHVFAGHTAGNADEALQAWQDIKAAEKAVKGEAAERSSQLSGIPRELPAVMAAYKLQQKASEAGFDWDRIEDVLEKVEEEINEVREQIHMENNIHTGERRLALKQELGDLLFSVVNAARFCHIDPEEALHLTNRKFILRFQYIEHQLERAGKGFADSNLAEMEQWWQEAKSSTEIL